MSDKNKNNKTGLIVFIVIIALAVIYAIAGAVINHTSGQSDYTVWQPSSTQRTGFDLTSTILSGSQGKKDAGPKIPKKAKYIAKLYITGTIQKEGQTYNQEWLEESIDMLKDDPNNTGILLVIDSPGGTVYEADATYLALMDYKSETGRPVYAYMESMAASGGYYIACAADYIIANRNTLTGSIGVIAGSFIDLTQLMENYGIKYSTVHAGKNKNMGNYNEPFTEEQQQIMQSIADECYDQFTEIVADSRNMSISEVRSLADGRVYTAKQAFDNGLIDCIVMRDKEVLTIMQVKEFEGEEYETVDFKYEQAQSLYSLFGEVSSKAALPGIVEDNLENMFAGPAYYYGGAIR